MASEQGSVSWSAPRSLLRIIRRDPTTGLQCGLLLLKSRLASRPRRPQLLVGTYHKVLTVFFLNIFKEFARFTGRTITSGQGHDLDYGCDVLRNTHSDFQWDKVAPGAAGLHVIRDPRDLIVSAANYHVRSAEPWLHLPREIFGGRSYQEAISALPNLEDRLIFEMDHSSGRVIETMLAWDYQRPGFAELHYEELVAPGGDRVFADAVEGLPITRLEKSALVRLFRFYSIGGSGSKGLKHIRNPASGQWRSAFTPRALEHFHNRFPGGLEKLGYSAE